MGQSHSRRSASSTGPRPTERRSTRSRPTSAYIESHQRRDTPPRNRSHRFSTHLPSFIVSRAPLPVIEDEPPEPVQPPAGTRPPSASAFPSPLGSHRIDSSVPDFLVQHPYQEPQTDPPIPQPPEVQQSAEVEPSSAATATTTRRPSPPRPHRFTPQLPTTILEQSHLEQEAEMPEPSPLQQQQQQQASQVEQIEAHPPAEAQLRTINVNRSPSSRRSRLSRAGSSFTNSIPSIFARNSSPSGSRGRRRASPPRPAQSSPTRPRTVTTRTAASLSPPRRRAPSAARRFSFASALAPHPLLRPQPRRAATERPPLSSSRPSSARPALVGPFSDRHSSERASSARPAPERPSSAAERPPSLTTDRRRFSLASAFSPHPLLRPEPRRMDSERPSSVADRISGLTPDRGFRTRTAPPLRRRRSPLGRPEDQGAMLSRLLSVVAAATAATLMGGNPEGAISDLRNATGDVDGDDGTFNGFLQALRNGRLTSALGQQQGDRSAAEGGEAADNPAPLEFFRMFRFGSSTTTRRRNGESSRPSSSRSDNSSPSNTRSEDGAEHRMVPILIVGIRALNGENDNGQDNPEGVPSFLDALTNGPTNFNMNLADGSDGLGAQTPDGVRFSQRRRASFGGLNFFSSGRDVLRSARSSTATRPRSEFGRPSGGLASASDSPTGPHAPPTTPASPPASALSSGTSTPTGRRPLLSNPAQLGTTSRRDSFIRRMTGSSLEPTAEESFTASPSSPTLPGTPRQRRVSDSDTPRFGSGSSRRNGMFVEPTIDDAADGTGTPTDSSAGGAGTNRSWIIYILGGSYPENHPILSTPSLFTDSPTYEDMLLLSSLLGPAKPPVANADDVAAAPGLLRIRVDGSVVSAVVVGGPGGGDGEVTVLAAGERCLVCLSDYEDGEQARRLVKCGHVFHRGCIDQWLTTGRNSCPLCRGLGVQDNTKTEDDAPEATETPQAAM